jgi:hypothetical protein
MPSAKRPTRENKDPQAKLNAAGFGFKSRKRAAILDPAKLVSKPLYALATHLPPTAFTHAPPIDSPGFSAVYDRYTMRHTPTIVHTAAMRPSARPRGGTRHPGVQNS